MDNQHKLIKGYRDLSQTDITVMNGLKEIEAAVGVVLTEIELENIEVSDPEANRWASLARTHLETGFMYAIKAVARPTNGLGRKT